MLPLNPDSLKDRLAAAKAERAKRRLFNFFVDYAWPVLQPGTAYSDNWHVHAICEHLEAVTSGEIKRLLINMPFRMLKSTLITQTWPAWEWLVNPSIQYLSASYSKDVATRDAVDSRRIIESEAYQRSFGHQFKMTTDQNVKTRYENDKKGTRTTTSTESAGTGFGGNRILVDDPVSALQADSEADRLQSVEWWKGTASTRLNNPKSDAIVVVQQRLHTDDLSGYILANEPSLGWVHLVLPMRFDPALRKTTSLGFVDPRKIKGELLSPDRLPESVVSEMETRLGGYHTSAQLQQNPAPREGVIFKKSDWKYYQVLPSQIAKNMDEIIWSWDCAFKGSLGSDNVAGLCIGRRGADKYLLARVSEKMTFSKTLTQVEVCRNSPQFAKKTIAVLVEDKANGPAVIDTLKDRIPALLPITPQGGKVARANAVQPQHEAGNFYLPDPQLPGCEWVEDLVDLFSRFTGAQGGVDDDVDAWTQGVQWFNTRESVEVDSPEPAVAGGREYN